MASAFAFTLAFTAKPECLTVRWMTEKSMNRIKTMVSFVAVLACAVPTYSDPGLDKELLYKAIWWDNELAEFGWTVSFKDDMFTAHFSGEGCGGYSGKFSTSGDAIILALDPAAACAPDFQGKHSKLQCTMKRAEDSLFRQIFLHCGGDIRLWANEPVVPTGSERKLQGMTVITEGLRKGVTKEAVKFRRKPQKNGASITCHLSDADRQIKEVTALPQGMKLKIIARTVEKVKVNNWTNYWYYIIPDLGWDDTCDGTKTGWVFGEFIQ